MNPKPLMVSLLALAFAFSGCDDDKTTPDATTGTPDATADATAETGGGDAAGCSNPAPPAIPTAPGCAGLDLTGTVFIVDTLEIQEPDNDALLTQLNDLFKTDIEADELIILFHVKSQDTAAGTAVIDAGSGLLEGGNYKWDGAPSELTVNVQGCGFATAADGELLLTPSTVNKPIVVSSLAVAGTFSEDGGTIPSASMTGSITRANATGLIVTLGTLEADLAELFDGFGLIENADVDCDGTPDGWTLGGDLTAAKVNNTEF